MAPSIWFENSPLTVHEAFLAGLPVIASAHGGLREFVEHERNGLLFEPGSSGDLRRAILRLARDRGLELQLARSVPSVKGIAEHAEELFARYEGLAASKRREGGLR